MDLNVSNKSMSEIARWKFPLSLMAIFFQAYKIHLTKTYQVACKIVSLKMSHNMIGQKQSTVRSVWVPIRKEQQYWRISIMTISRQNFNRATQTTINICSCALKRNLTDITDARFCASTTIIPSELNVTIDTMSAHAFPFWFNCSARYPWTASVSVFHGAPDIEPDASKTKIWWLKPLDAKYLQANKWSCTIEWFACWPRGSLLSTISCQASKIQYEGSPSCSAASHWYGHNLKLASLQHSWQDLPTPTSSNTYHAIPRPWDVMDGAPTSVYNVDDHPSQCIHRFYRCGQHRFWFLPVIFMRHLVSRTYRCRNIIWSNQILQSVWLDEILIPCSSTPRFLFAKHNSYFMVCWLGVCMQSWCGNTSCFRFPTDKLARNTMVNCMHYVPQRRKSKMLCGFTPRNEYPIRFHLRI